jgi:uncharacterized protein
MDLKVALLGLFIGFLIGLTGMGGGALMTPALILLHLARPALAVGTDIVWSALTRVVGSFVHIRQKTVDMAIVKRLALGSMPGAVLGVAVLAFLRQHEMKSEDKLVVWVLGSALIVVGLSLFVRMLLGSSLPVPGQEGVFRGPAWLTTLMGAVVGFLVSISSVGAGSLIVASLVFIYPTTPLKRLVGSDVVHGLFLLGVAALGHAGLGTIDYRLLVGLLLGSIPGVWVGSKLSAKFPDQVLRPVLATTLLYLGLKLL